MERQHTGIVSDAGAFRERFQQRRDDIGRGLPLGTPMQRQ